MERGENEDISDDMVWLVSPVFEGNAGVAGFSVDADASAVFAVKFKGGERWRVGELVFEDGAE